MREVEAAVRRRRWRMWRTGEGVGGGGRRAVDAQRARSKSRSVEAGRQASKHCAAQRTGCLYGTAVAMWPETNTQGLGAEVACGWLAGWLAVVVAGK